MPHSRYIVRPAAQAVIPTSCPVAPHCASLPSSSAAYEDLSGGGVVAWVKVLGSMVLRGALIAGAIKVFDPKDKHWLRHGAYGAVGIEAFVLAYTGLTMPNK